MKIENYKLKIGSSGFSLLEIVMVISIFTIVLVTALYFFSKLNKKEVLEKDVSSAVALIRNARALSVTSKNASPFGIHLENDKVVLFEGSSYIAGGVNEKIIKLSGDVYISEYFLNLGGPDIIFSRLIGNTSNYGTVTFSLKDDSASTTITILSTGVIQ